MPFDALQGPALTERLTWLWNHREALSELEWQEFYVRVVHDIFGRYSFGELGGLLNHFDRESLCAECFEEKILFPPPGPERPETHPAFYRRMFHNFLVEVFRRHRDIILNTVPLHESDPGEDTSGPGEAIEYGTESVEPLEDPHLVPLGVINQEFASLLVASARAFLARLDDVDVLLVKCWFAQDDERPALVRFRAIVGAKYNSRAIRLGIKQQSAEKTYADYAETFLGKLWADVWGRWLEIYPDSYVPEDGFIELLSTVKREALQLASPDCRVVLAVGPTALGGGQ